MPIVRPNIPVNQSTKIFFGLFIGYLVYVTIKGELPAYAAILIGTAPTTAQTDATASGGAGYNPAGVDASIYGQTTYGQDGSITSPIGSIGPAPTGGGSCTVSARTAGLC